MITLYRLMDAVHGSGITDRLGWVLLHSLWIETAVAALLAAALWLLRNSPATHRYAAGCAAMALMVGLPVMTAALAYPQSHAPARRPVIAPPMAMRLGPARTPADAAVVASVAANVFDRMGPWLAWGVAAWLAGVAGLSLRHLVGWAQAQSLARRGEEPSERWWRRLSELGQTLHLKTPVRLRVTRRLHVPAVIGWLRPVILVPVAALTDLTPQQLESLLLHELAHICRNDYLVNLLQTAAETLLFYHPAVWWASRVVRQERENCCDDLAADHCGSRTLYARALTAMEELRAVPGRFAVAASGGTLLARVRRVVGLFEERPDRRMPALAALFTITACVLLTVAPKLVAQERREQSAPRTEAASSRPAEEGDGIEPQDLKEDHNDYRISPDDLLAVTVAELNGPNSQTVKQSRVSESGLISVPLLEPLTVAGKTELETERAIADAYRERNVLAHAQVSVTVIEARGRAFSVMGNVQKPGEYAMVESKMRLLDALALAGGPAGDLKSLLVVRRDGESSSDQHSEKQAKPKTRRIRIDGAKLMSGDADVNVFVRPHDVIMVTAEGGTRPAAPRSVTIVVDKAGLRFDGKPATWDDIAAALEKLPDHPSMVVQLSAGYGDLTVSRLFEARAKAQELVRKYGFKQLIVSGTGDAPVGGSDRKSDAGPFEVYMGGRGIARPGVYNVRPEERPTLRQMLIAAGAEHGDDAAIVIIRRKPGGGEDFIRTTLKKATAEGSTDVVLQPSDRVMVGKQQ